MTLLSAKIATAAETMYVQGRFLYAPDGERVTLRGVNKMNVWTDMDGSLSFPQIQKSGSNSVRIVWLATRSASELDAIVSRAISNSLIPIVELHEATCKNLDSAEFRADLSYWLQPDVVQVIKKYERKLIVNIANEAGWEDNAKFSSIYIDAVAKIRAAGVRVPLVIDAGTCGQNLDQLQIIAPQILGSDPLKNILFSIHTYWPPERGWTDAKITQEIQDSVNLNIPLIIGEYAASAYNAGGPCLSVNVGLVMSLAQQYSISALAWEWGPGNSDCGNLDMTTNNVAYTSWGHYVVFDHPNSISKTSIVPGFMKLTNTQSTSSQPYIQTFSPNSGAIGSVFNIYGSGFLGTTAVKINNLVSNSFAVISDTQLSVTIASGATTGQISIFNSNGKATWSPNSYTIISSNPTAIGFSLMTTQLSTNSISSGQSISISPQIAASASATGIIVDIEIFDTLGVRQAQYFAENQTFAAGQTRTFNYSYFVPFNLPSGTYKISVGIFSSGWQKNYNWITDAAVFSVTNQAPPASLTMPFKIMPMGDSMTGEPRAYRLKLYNTLIANNFKNNNFQYVGSQTEIWPSDGISSLPPTQLQHEGYPGITISGITQKVSMVATYQPNILILQVGANDIAAYQSGSIQKIVNQYIDLINRLRAASPNTVIYACELTAEVPLIVPPFGNDRSVLVSQFNTLMATQLSTLPGFGTQIKLVRHSLTQFDLRDGLHPTDRGYQKFAEDIFAGIK